MSARGSCYVMLAAGRMCRFCLRRAMTTRPSRPDPNNQIASGIGTGTGTVSPFVPNENTMSVMVVAAVTPVSASVNVALALMNGL